MRLCVHMRATQRHISIINGKWTLVASNVSDNAICSNNYAQYSNFRTNIGSSKHASNNLDTYCFNNNYITYNHIRINNTSDVASNLCHKYYPSGRSYDFKTNCACDDFAANGFAFSNSGSKQNCDNSTSAWVNNLWNKFKICVDNFETNFWNHFSQNNSSFHTHKFHTNTFSTVNIWGYGLPR